MVVHRAKCALFRWHPALLKTWAEHCQWMDKVSNKDLWERTSQAQIEICSMHTNRLAVGSWRYRQMPTENRRSSAGVYQTPTRSSGLIGAIPPIQNLNRRKSQSALVGRCVPNTNPIVGANRQVCIDFRLDSTVGGKLTNHSYHFKYLLDIFQGHARPDFAANFASTSINDFMHFRHFCFLVSICARLIRQST